MSGTRPTDLATIKGPAVFGMEAPHIQPLIEKEVVEPASLGHQHHSVTAALSDRETVKLLAT